MTDDEDELTPEERAAEDLLYAENEKFIREHVESGWVWNASENTLTAPEDEELQYWINPYTYERLLSVKFVELLKMRILQQIKADSGEK